MFFFAGIAFTTISYSSMSTKISIQPLHSPGERRAVTPAGKATRLFGGMGNRIPYEKDPSLKSLREPIMFSGSPPIPLIDMHYSGVPEHIVYTLLFRSKGNNNI